jgi:hypothetical protein
MTLAKSALAALLGTALAAAPAFGQTAEDLKKAIDRLDKAAKELEDARTALKSDGLREKVTLVDSKIDAIDADVRDIKREIRDLKRRLENGSTSTALRPDYDSVVDRDRGRVRFINEFREEMSVVLNGRSYRLLPGEERLISVPSGSFTYQVLQIQRFTQDRRIASGETKTIRIYPLD